MNTPDTEVETQDTILQVFKDKYPLPAVGYDGSDEDYKERAIQHLLVKELIYRAVVSGKKSAKDLLSSRDTYWKERVRKEVEGIKKKPICRNPACGKESHPCQNTIKNQALDTLLDNLK